MPTKPRYPTARPPFGSTDPRPAKTAASASLCTVTEAARLLKVTRGTIYRWVHCGDLHSFRLAGHLRLSRDEVLRFKVPHPVRIARPTGRHQR